MTFGSDLDTEMAGLWQSPGRRLLRGQVTAQFLHGKGQRAYEKSDSSEGHLEGGSHPDTSLSNLKTRGTAGQMDGNTCTWHSLGRHWL